MKQFKSFGLVVVTLLFSVTMAFAAKPNIHIPVSYTHLDVYKRQVYQ